MRAWLMENYEGVDKLRLGEIADPVPGPQDALLQVHLAGLNPADAFLAQAMYPAKPELPHILGRDGVGEVLAIGSEVQTVRVGDTVGVLRGDTGVDAWGTLAERVVVPATNLVRVPADWTLEEMSGAPLTFLTAWQALTQWSDPPAPPTDRSVLLITGASGGVGTASIQLGRSMHLTVVALTRKMEKAAKLMELGADHVLQASTASMAQDVLAAIAPQRVDLVVDTVGGPLFNVILGLLGQGGRVSVVGRSGGVVPEFNTARLFFRRNRIGGVAVSDFTPDAAQQAWHQIVGRLNSMGQRPVVDSVFRFEDLKQAFARLELGHLGKVLVRIGEPAP